MKTHYLLPAAVALLGHAALLFGVVSAPAPIRTEVGDDLVTERILIPLLPPEEERVVERDDAEMVERKPEERSLASGGAPPPTISDFDFGERLLVPVGNVGPERPLLRMTGGEGPIGGAGASRVFSMGDLDHVPRVRSSAAPGYPFAARSAGLTGEVVVEFLVNELGEVVAPRVLRSSDPVFVEPALKAAARWRFEPGRKDGRPVRFRMAVPFVFTLDR